MDVFYEPNYEECMEIGMKLQYIIIAFICRWSFIIVPPTTNSALEQASQWHEMYSHDLEVMSSNPCWVKLEVRGASVLCRTWTHPTS